MSPATRALPTGTVTLLFTDIEGSTKLLARLGDQAYGDLLETQRGIVVEAIDAHGGAVVSFEGDAVFAAFPGAAAGVRAAVAAQRALAAHPWPGGPLRVRMGLHTGEVQVSNDDYHGFEVHRAARVGAVAHGGQVIVSGATRALAEPGDGIGFRDLGEHRLKDIDRVERLYQVEAPGLETDFPPPRAIDAGPPGNLPTELSSFVGRAEVARAEALLDRTRLLTLTGPGGTGKTRLSLQLATACRDRFPDGAWFVALALVIDPELIGSAIAAALGLLATDRMPIDVVREHLASRTALLVLDNFEQVVEGAPVVADLLRAAPALTVIVSSRAPLRIAGEQEFPVPPLAVPPAGTTSVDEIAASEAVRLFAERAMAVRPDFAVTSENAGDVAEIVRRLDGLPLAIELAAARVRLLGAGGIARRLDDRLGLLSGGGRDLPERQRTLRGAIEWSHDLLDPGQRRLFARLSAFARGGPLDQAETVCALPGETPEPPVIEGLEQLAEQSLVRVGDDPHGDLRFSMLETIHEFAAERLAEAGEQPALRERHAAVVLAFVEAPPPPDGNRRPWLDRMDDEHDNLRAAYEYLVEVGDAERVSRLVLGSWRFWQMRGHVLEGRRRVERVLALPGFPGGAPRARLRALEAEGGLAYWSGDLAASGRAYRELEEEARRLGDERAIAEASYNRFFAQEGLPDPQAWQRSMAENRHLLDDAIEIWTRLGDELGVARGTWGIGEYHVYRREYGPSEAALTKALEVFERYHDQFWIAWARFTRSIAHVGRGDVASAAADAAGALHAFRAAGDVSGMALLVSGISSFLLAAGDELSAYRVAGAGERIVSETGLRLAHLTPDAGMARFPDTATADPVLRAALDEGASWSRADAVDRTIALAEALAASGAVAATPWAEPPAAPAEG